MDWDYEFKSYFVLRTLRSSILQTYNSSYEPSASVHAEAANRWTVVVGDEAPVVVTAGGCPYGTACLQECAKCGVCT